MLLGLVLLTVTIILSIAAVHDAEVRRQKSRPILHIEQ